jgi:hypothetical protein
VGWIADRAKALCHPSEQSPTTLLRVRDSTIRKKCAPLC